MIDNNNLIIDEEFDNIRMLKNNNQKFKKNKFKPKNLLKDKDFGIKGCISIFIIIIIFFLIFEFVIEGNTNSSNL